VVQGLQRIIRETGRTIEVVREESGTRLGYQSPEWYQNEAMTDREYLHGRQGNAGKIVELLRSHDTSHDHFIVLITGADLTSGEEGNNFIYGLRSYPYIIVSAKRFLDWKQTGKGGYSGEIYDEAVSLTAAHEFGHYLDLVQRNFNSWTNTGTLLDQHCKGENGDCLMQQSNVDAPGCHTALEQAQLLFDRENRLCPDCRLEVQYRKEALLDAGLAW
jgi:predicted Zn-dependent protease